jgi:hypothetical protein
MLSGPSFVLVDEILCYVLAFGEPDVGEDELLALVEELPGNRLAHFASGASDHDHLSLK